jgi:hypothetical protein
MKSKPLEKSVADYVSSLEKVLEKRRTWNEHTRPLLREALGRICTRYEIGWKVQELDWLWNNKAINLMFDSVPKALEGPAGGMKDFDFVKGTALVFSQKYNGDISILILYPEVGDASSESDFKELGSFRPDSFSESFVEEKVSDFLEEIMVWEENIMRHRVGF